MDRLNSAQVQIIKNLLTTMVNKRCNPDSGGIDTSTYNTSFTINPAPGEHIKAEHGQKINNLLLLINDFPQLCNST
jgi:hypothetical protein